MKRGLFLLVAIVLVLGGVWAWSNTPSATLSSLSANGIGFAVFTSRLVFGRHLLKVYNQGGGRLQQSLP